MKNKVSLYTVLILIGSSYFVYSMDDFDHNTDVIEHNYIPQLPDNHLDHDDSDDDDELNIFLHDDDDFQEPDAEQIPDDNDTDSNAVDMSMVQDTNSNDQNNITDNQDETADQMLARIGYTAVPMPEDTTHDMALVQDAPTIALGYVDTTAHDTAGLPLIAVVEEENVEEQNNNYDNDLHDDLSDNHEDVENYSNDNALDYNQDNVQENMQDENQDDMPQDDQEDLFRYVFPDDMPEGDEDNTQEYDQLTDEDQFEGDDEQVVIQGFTENSSHVVENHLSTNHFEKNGDHTKGELALIDALDNIKGETNSHENQTSTNPSNNEEALINEFDNTALKDPYEKAQKMIYLSESTSKNPPAIPNFPPEEQWRQPDYAPAAVPVSTNPFEEPNYPVPPIPMTDVYLPDQAKTISTENIQIREPVRPEITSFLDMKNEAEKNGQTLLLSEQEAAQNVNNATTPKPTALQSFIAMLKRALGIDTFLQKAKPSNVTKINSRLEKITNWAQKQFDKLKTKPGDKTKASQGILTAVKNKISLLAKTFGIKSNNVPDTIILAYAPVVDGQENKTSWIVDHPSIFIEPSNNKIITSVPEERL